MMGKFELNYAKIFIYLFLVWELDSWPGAVAGAVPLSCIPSSKIDWMWNSKYLCKESFAEFLRQEDHDIKKLVSKSVFDEMLNWAAEIGIVFSDCKWVTVVLILIVTQVVNKIY